MNASIRTKKTADGTYAYAIIEQNVPLYWNRSTATTEIGARVQGAPYLAEVKRAAEWLATRPRFTGDTGSQMEAYGQRR